MVCGRCEMVCGRCEMVCGRCEMVQAGGRINGKQVPVVCGKRVKDGRACGMCAIREVHAELQAD